MSSQDCKVSSLRAMPLVLNLHHPSSLHSVPFPCQYTVERSDLSNWGFIFEFTGLVGEADDHYGTGTILPRP